MMRRNFPGRRIKRFGRRTHASTGQWGKPFSVPYKKRRMGRRAWGRVLFRDTQADSHYRSVAQDSSVAPTPNSVGTMFFYFVPALKVGITVPFYVTAGGLQQLDSGITPPLFTGDLTLRGGIIRFAATNPSLVDSIRVRVWLVRTNASPNFNVLPGDSVPLPWDWDPSIVADFSTFGRVLWNREAILRPNGNSFTVDHRIQPEKVEQRVFFSETGKQYIWMFTVGKYSNGQISATDISVIKSYSVSFSGDANNA